MSHSGRDSFSLKGNATPLGNLLGESHSSQGCDVLVPILSASDVIEQINAAVQESRTQHRDSEPTEVSHMKR